MRQSIILAALIGAGSALAQITKCSLDKKCPESAPCCSQFGECGVGAYCLGGCDPRMSFSFEACVPAPVCRDSTTKFDNMDSIVDIGEYLGDPDDTTWIAQGEPRLFNDNLLLTMPKDSGGSLISSASYMWYGTVKARMKTSRGKGVITAFILFSDIKDEVDYEWVGVDLETAQTNYYFQGVLDWHNSENITVSDSFNNFHDYEIRWTPDTITWAIDGQVGRVVERKETFNKTTQQFEYPQTPSRVQLSLWPGGLPDNAQGTIDWAGGVIDWNHEDVKKAGYYYVTIESISIECYSADSAPGTNKGVSYKYEEGAGTNDTVIDGDAPTVIGSLMATGLDMDKGKPADDEDDEDTNDDEDNNDEDKDDAVSQIPGGGSGTSAGNDHSGSEDGTSAGLGDSPAGSFGGGGGSSSPPPDCDPSQWHSSCGSTSGDDSEANSNNGGSGGDSGGSKSSASALAIVIAGIALCWL